MRALSIVTNVTLILMFSATFCCGQDSPVVLVHHDRGRLDGGLIKWDCPVFAAYEDGTVIWRRAWENSLEALSITATSKAARLVEGIKNAVDTYSGTTFLLTGASDASRTKLWYNGRTVEIVGEWRQPYRLEFSGGADPETLAEANRRELARWSTLPPEIRALLSDLANFDALDRKRWQPEEYILRLDPPIRTVVEALDWPMDWPQEFHSVPNTTNINWIELPGATLADLLRKLRGGEDRKAVKIRSEVRPVAIHLIFPGRIGGSFVEGLSPGPTKIKRKPAEPESKLGKGGNAQK